MLPSSHEWSPFTKSSHAWLTLCCRSSCPRLMPVSMTPTCVCAALQCSVWGHWESRMSAASAL